MTELIFGNRVVETAFASGTGPFSLQNRLETYYSRFSEKFQIGSAVTYCALYNDLKEIGYGILTSENQLTRLKVYDSSTPNGFVNSATPGSPSFVDFPDGAQITIFNDIPAQLLVLIGSNGELVNPGPIRNALFVADTAALKAMVDVDDEDKIFVVSNGLFVYDAEDATDPDNVDTFRLDDTTTGLMKRNRLDIQGTFLGSATINAAANGTGGFLKLFANLISGHTNDWFDLFVDTASSALRVRGRFNQSSAVKNLLSVFSLGTTADRVEVHEPLTMPTRTDATGLVARGMVWASGVSRLILMMTGGGYREIALVKGYPTLYKLDIYALKQEDAGALSLQDGDIALCRGSNAIVDNSTETNAGNVDTIRFYWSPASTATEDLVNVVRPAVGAAATGAGRWLREVSNVDQTFTSGVATPSVKNGTWFVTNGNTAITDLLNEYEGQIIVLQRGNVDIVITHDATKISLQGRANRTLTLDDPRVTLRNVGGVWYEISSGALALKASLSALSATTGATLVGWINGLTGGVARTLAGKFSDTISVKDFGATGDGTTIDTAAIQAALNAAYYQAVYFPAGHYAIDDELLVTSATLLKGAGVWNTFITQKNLTKNGVYFNPGYGAGGGLRNISIHADVTNPAGTRSSGIALKVNRASGVWTARDFDINGFATGIQSASNFYTYFKDFQILHASTAAIHLAPHPAIAGYQNSGGVFFSTAKVSNFGTDSSNTGSVGILIESAAGDHLTSLDCTSFDVNIKIAPAAGCNASFLFMNRILGDSGDSHNWIFDSTNGTITCINCVDCWASFATNGYGVWFKGATNLIDDVKWTGGNIRDNGKHGIKADYGRNLRFNGVAISSNSKLSTLTYDGVRCSSADLISIALLDCRIGNFSSGGTQKQLNNVRLDLDVTGLVEINGCNLDVPGSGGSPLYNVAGGATVALSGNTPGQQGLNRPEGLVIPGCTQTVVPTNSDVYLGPNGFQTLEYDAYYMVGMKGSVRRLYIAPTGSPAAGQTFTVTLRKNGVDTTMTGIITSAMVELDIFGLISVEEKDFVSVHLVTSLTAGAQGFRYFIEIGK